jgi:hypothetical protein
MRTRWPSAPRWIVGAWLGIGLAFMPGSTRAQTPAPATGGSSYLPFGSMGGFVPYSPGPGQGLGVMPGDGRRMTTDPRAGMRMLGQSQGLGQFGGTLTAPAPIGLRGMGSQPGGRMGSMGGFIRRPGPGGGMGGMARPPVGNYPFRQPPSLIGPATTMPSMSM